ncbi:MAG TPA: flagellar filament capping protein FliD [Baekduia sp.]|nr:flagellar filament capping protein FliD [Baekduia sp.]
MAGIQLSGLVSGLDTQSIISQLIAAESAPRTRMTFQQAAATKRQSLLQELNTKVTALKNASDDLKSAGTWLDTQKVTSSDDSKVGVTRTAGAPPGGYDVAVTQLASAERRTYDYQPPAADGPLTIYEADGTTVRTTVDLKAGATVDDAVAAINSKADSKLFAVNVNGDLVLAAKDTGVSSAFSVTGAGTQIERVAGQDAQFSIGTTSYTRSTNVVDDALPGVTLTLKAKTGADPVGITIGGPGPDKDGVVAKVKAFVDAYNALVTTARADLSEERVPTAANSLDAQKGTLHGDSGISGMLSSLRASVAAAVPGLTGTLTSLADIGVSTGAANSGSTINQDAVDGKLTFDSAKLTAALDSNPLGVRTLLGGIPDTPGFAQGFTDVIGPYQGTGGIFDERIQSAGKDLTRIKDQLDAFDQRMSAKQDYLQKQFTALESALQQSQSMQSSLVGYLGQSAGS